MNEHPTRPDPSEWRPEDYAPRRSSSGLDRSIHRYHRRLRGGVPGWIKSGIALAALACAVAIIESTWRI